MEQSVSDRNSLVPRKRDLCELLLELLPNPQISLFLRECFGDINSIFWNRLQDNVIQIA